MRDENETPKEDTEGQQEGQSTETSDIGVEDAGKQDNDSQDSGVGN